MQIYDWKGEIQEKKSDKVKYLRKRLWYKHVRYYTDTASQLRQKIQTQKFWFQNPKLNQSNNKNIRFTEVKLWDKK